MCEETKERHLQNLRRRYDVSPTSYSMGNEVQTNNCSDSMDPKTKPIKNENKKNTNLRATDSL